MSWACIVTVSTYTDPYGLERWATIQDVFYRKEEVYTMSWKIQDLSDYVFAGARNGGPIG